MPYVALPYFWQSWMYWLTPFKYLLEGFLGLLLNGVPIRCESTELAIFPPPPGQDCQSYAGGFAQQSGGYVETQPNGDCGFCQYSSGTNFAASFNVFPRYIWRDFGIMCKCLCPNNPIVPILTTYRGLYSFQFRRCFLLHVAVSGRPPQDQGCL